MSKLTVRCPSKLFFTADTHFGHKNIMKYCNRPFNSVEEMTEAIINTWNSVVGETDTVIHLGDFSFLKAEQSAAIYKRLNGGIILVRGNHDSDNIINACGFDDVVDFLELKVYEQEGTAMHQPISCMHYPMAVWPSSHYGAWHLHGHSHGSYTAKDGKILDVGWDVFGKPVSYVEVREYMSKRRLLEADHHSIKKYRENACNSN